MTRVPDARDPHQQQIDAAYITGRGTGREHAAIGSNVAAAYYFAGIEFVTRILLRVPAGVSVDGLREAFFDGFTTEYWSSVTTRQKSGPYA